MKARAWIALAVGLILCLGVAYGAYALANYSWNQVVDYRGPYAKQAIPPTADLLPGSATEGHIAQATPPRVVYVIVDGLREDASRTMPNLENLRAHGYDAVVKTSQPSLSFPNWTTLMSGASQRFSGVTTNWFEAPVPVETLIDVALESGASDLIAPSKRMVVVSAPTDFEMLFGVKRVGNVFLRNWTEDEYMTGEIVDHAISLTAETSASLVIVHFPDVDEAGHAYGGASKQYADMALKVDADLGRLVSALQGPNTTFVVTADHGHIATGGHGGPEAIVTQVPAVFAGPRVKLGKGTGTQDQVAPTVALLAELPAPRNATGLPLEVTVESAQDIARFDAQQTYAYEAYTRAIAPGPINTADLDNAASARRLFEKATTERLARERSARLPVALALAVAFLAAIVAVGLLSWRGLVAALAGAIAYYAAWDGSYFLLHGYRWSLSSFNSEALLKGFLNGRMVDAVVAGVVAAVVSGLIYLAMRRPPRAARGEFLPGWLALGVATVLVIQATLAIQVAWYLWWWGASVSWYIPDLAMGFKYDLDLIQLTGLGAAVLIAPVVTFLVGRYHPKVRRAQDVPA